MGIKASSIFESPEEREFVKSVIDLFSEPNPYRSAWQFAGIKPLKKPRRAMIIEVVDLETGAVLFP
jgi:hypothetical protein